MINAAVKYGALSAKLHGMYGKMLKESDWQRLDAMNSVREVIQYLTSSPGFKDAGLTASVSGGDITMSGLAESMSRQVESDRQKLYLHMPREDREYFAFDIHREEYMYILRSMRRLHSKEAAVAPPPSRQAAEKSRLDFEALKTAASFSDISRAASKTIYAPALRALEEGVAKGESGYGIISLALENQYYSRLYNFLVKKYKGGDKKRLKENLGEEADITNIMHILRMQRHFKSSLSGGAQALIPVRRRLTAELAEALINAQDEESAAALLRDSYWKSLFSDYTPRRLEELSEKARMHKYYKMFRSPVPGITMAEGYLGLKQAQCLRLIRLISALKYRQRH